MTKKPQPLQVAFQGAPGAFSHRAGQIFVEQHKLDPEAKYVPCRSFDEVFDSVLSYKCALGVIPLENTSIGSIVANFDLLYMHPVMMVGEIYIPIHHQLIGFEGTSLKSLTSVYSHPAALDQCKVFLKSLPAVKPQAYWDTSGAALHVSASKDRKSAAIASEFAAKEANLAILKRDIEDHEGNSTRFGIIVPSLEHKSTDIRKKPDPRVGPLVEETGKKYPLKMSCVAELAHTPGTLANLLNGLVQSHINLTKIESRPVPDAPWHYRFFLDMVVDSKEKEHQVIEAIKERTETVKLLGRYQIWEAGMS
ncbi:MAG: hypothetical protein C0469_10225 [Cyanobacteria bacterium DS2.3.42]|nr:hypothetical protein [Cyanobacteria bacterium DS2.3.42]